MARGASRDDAEIAYKPSFELAAPASRRPGPDDAHRARCWPRSSGAASDELDRGISLVGPHRDDLVLTLGQAPDRPGCR